LNGGITSGDGAIARDCDSIELKDEDETDCETDCDKCDINGVAVVDNVDDDDMDADGDECASDVEIGGGATTMLFFFFFSFLSLNTCRRTCTYALQLQRCFGCPWLNFDVRKNTNSKLRLGGVKVSFLGPGCL